MLQVWHVRALGQRVCIAAATAAVAGSVVAASPGGAADGSNAADSAQCGGTTGTVVGSVSPPPPPYGGRSRRWGPRQCTRPSPRAAHTMRVGPRRTRAADAHKCIGAGNPARPGRMGSPSNHSHNHSPSQQASHSNTHSPPLIPSPSPSLKPGRACEREGGGG